MNKRGGSLLFGVTVGLVIFIFGVLIIPFFVDDITVTRTALDCTNVSISDGTKLTCLQTDIIVPYLIWFFTSLAIGILAGANK